jgi:N-acetylmuramoyl-L-alanine amidase
MKKTLIIVIFALGISALAHAAEPLAYFPVESAAKSKGFQCQWDPTLKNLVILGKEGNIKMHVGSEFILDRNKFTRLDRKVTYSNGEVTAPLSLQYYLNQLTPTSRVSSVALLKPAPVVPAPAPHAMQTAILQAPPSQYLKKIVIDAGHGGHDFGAISPRGLREKDVVLDVARMVSSELRKAGIEVVMTRSRDVYIPLAGRAHIANEKNADLFISIHANASLTRSLNGFEIYTLSEATDDTALALERAENSPLAYEHQRFDHTARGSKAVVWGLTEQENRKESILLANHVANSVQSSVDIAHRRIKSANFYVIKWTELPAILVELGYLTNKEDERLLRSTIYRQNMAKAIVSGVLKYGRDLEETDGFTR